MKPLFRLFTLLSLFLLVFSTNAQASLGNMSGTTWYIGIEGAIVGLILGCISCFNRKLGNLAAVAIFFAVSAIGALFIKVSFQIIFIILVLQAVFALLPMMAVFMVIRFLKNKYLTLTPHSSGTPNGAP